MKVIPGGKGDILKFILVGFRCPGHRRTYAPAPPGRQVEIHDIGWRVSDSVLRIKRCTVCRREWRGVGVMGMPLGTGHIRQGEQRGEKVYVHQRLFDRWRFAAAAI